MAENVPPASAQATSVGSQHENLQNPRYDRRGSGNKHRGNQRSYSQNRSKNDLSQVEGYSSGGGPRGGYNNRGGKQGLIRNDQRISRQDQENEFNNFKSHTDRRGRLAYSSDRNRQGNSTDRNSAIHSRDRSLQPVPSTSFSGVQAVFDLIKDGPRNTNKTHGGSNKSLLREDNGEQEKRLNKNPRFNSCENISKKRDSESFKRNSNQKFDENRVHRNNQASDRPRQMRNENAQGPQRKPPNKRGPNYSGGIKPPYKVVKFNNEHFLRENQISNTVQTESHPELFSYEELARELEEQKPLPVDKDVKNTINHTVKKRKKAGKLVNSVKKSDDSPGNIPNEFKRRRKPGRLTLLNRIRKGLPVDSDDDEQDYVQVENKRKKASETKKKVMELLMNRRSLRNEEDPDSADSSDYNAIRIDNNAVKDQDLEARGISTKESPLNITSVDNIVNVSMIETTEICIRESPVSDIQTRTIKQHNKVLSMTDSSDDSDENGEFDKRNQRKFDAFKISNDLASHLAKHKLGQTKSAGIILKQDGRAESSDGKTNNAVGAKDLKLSQLKEIIEARRKSENNNSTREENNKKVDEIKDKMNRLDLNNKRNNKTNVESNDKNTKENDSKQSEKIATTDTNPVIEGKENSASKCEMLDEQNALDVPNKVDDESLTTPKLPIAASVEDNGKYTESKIVASQTSEITLQPAASVGSNEVRCEESIAPNDKQEIPRNKTDKEEEKEEGEEEEEDEEEETDESDEDIETKLRRALQELSINGTLDKRDQVMDYLQNQLRKAKEVPPDDASVSQPPSTVHEMKQVKAQCGEDIRVDDSSVPEAKDIGENNEHSSNSVTIIRDGNNFSMPEIKDEVVSNQSFEGVVPNHRIERDIQNKVEIQQVFRGIPKPKVEEVIILCDSSDDDEDEEDDDEDDGFPVIRAI